MIQRIVVSLIGFFLMSCASLKGTPDMAAHEPTQWSARALVINHQTSRENSVDIDAFLNPKGLLRIDISGSFAVGLATAVVDSEHRTMTSLLPQQKFYYQGPANGKALQSLLQVDLDPLLIFYLFRDEAIREKGWKCDTDGAGKPTRCEFANPHYMITWSERNGVHKKVILKSDRFELQLAMTQVPTKVQDWEKVFIIKIPESYRPI